MGEEQIARLHHVELICKKMPWFEDLVELTGEGGWFYSTSSREGKWSGPCYVP